jgi:hypothetical protein
VRSLIPEALHARTFIAGGAAIAPHTATDVDVWVIGDDDSREELFAFAEERWGPLLGGNADITVYGEGDNLTQTPVGLSDEEAEAYRINLTDNWREAGIKFVGITHTSGAKPIQVLHVDKVRGVIDLLGHFDISVHQWAQNLRTPLQNYAGPWATLPSALPRVTRWNTPTTTVRRLRKLLYRYGWDYRAHPDYAGLKAAAERQGKSRAFETAMSYHPDRITPEEVPF